MTREEFINRIKPHEEFINLCHNTRTVVSSAPFEDLYATHLSFFGAEAKIDSFCGTCVMGFYDGLWAILQQEKQKTAA